MLGLRCNIYKSNLGDCSNGGISSRCSEVVLVGPEVAGVHEPDASAPAVEFAVRNIGMKDYLTAYPAGYKTSGKWFMFGGCFVYTSDGRFPSDYPIPLHDRTE